jgi:type VI secretion system secreted protein Hcp
MESRNSSHQSRSNNFPAVSNFHSGGGGSEFGGAGTGKGYVKDLTVTKYVDKSSPALMLGCCSGTHYPSALLTVRKVGGKEPVEYLKIKMQEVFISSVSTRIDTNCFQMSEELILNFAKVSVDYTPQNPDGSKGIAIPFSWDIPSNCTE